jgi:pyruvate dehydrogenase E2 component (dihydrolipoamide acetyltransferase)
MAQTAKGDTEVVELTPAQQAAVRRVAEARATVPELIVAVAAPPRSDAALVRAVATALREQPGVNGAYRDGHLERFSRVNVAVVLEGADGPVAPVVFDADGKDEETLAAELAELGAAARDGNLAAPRLAGATFTIAGLGTTGLRRLQPVIVPPQAAVLGAAEELTLVCDARALTAAQAAAFAMSVAALL